LILDPIKNVYEFIRSDKPLYFVTIFEGNKIIEIIKDCYFDRGSTYILRVKTVRKLKDGNTI
jgi:hypothetical protein